MFYICSKRVRNDGPRRIARAEGRAACITGVKGGARTFFAGALRNPLKKLDQRSGWKETQRRIEGFLARFGAPGRDFRASGARFEIRRIGQRGRSRPDERLGVRGSSCRSFRPLLFSAAARRRVRNEHEHDGGDRPEARRSGDDTAKETLHRRDHAGRGAGNVRLRRRRPRRGRGRRQRRGSGRIPAFRLRVRLWQRGRSRRGARSGHPGRPRSGGALGHLEAVEQQARREGRDRLVRKVARRPAPRLSRPVPRALAVPELPPARLRRVLAQPGRQALHSCATS